MYVLTAVALARNNTTLIEMVTVGGISLLVAMFPYLNSCLRTSLFSLLLPLVHTALSVEAGLGLTTYQATWTSVLRGGLAHTVRAVTW
jgi:hypothetical protein